MVEAGTEAEPGDLAIGDQADELALLLGCLQLDPGRQQQLPAGQPGRRIAQLGDVNPANLALGHRPRASRELQLELQDEAFDGQHAISR